MIDLATGAITVLDHAWIGDGRQVFADDGSVLLGTLTFMPQPVLWNPVSPQTLNLSRTPSLARVSHNKAKVVYEAVTAEQRTLVTYDVTSGVETVLATGPGSPDQFPSHFYPWITNDGRTVLLMSTDAADVRQAFLISSVGSNPRQLTHEPEGHLGSDSQRIWQFGIRSDAARTAVADRHHHRRGDGAIASIGANFFDLGCSGRVAGRVKRSWVEQDHCSVHEQHCGAALFRIRHVSRFSDSLGGIHHDAIRSSRSGQLELPI